MVMRWPNKNSSQSLKEIFIINENLVTYLGGYFRKFLGVPGSSSADSWQC